MLLLRQNPLDNVPSKQTTLAAGELQAPVESSPGVKAPKQMIISFILSIPLNLQRYTRYSNENVMVIDGNACACDLGWMPWGAQAARAMKAVQVKVEYIWQVNFFCVSPAS